MSCACGMSVDVLFMWHVGSSGQGLVPVACQLFRTRSCACCMSVIVPNNAYWTVLIEFGRVRSD